MVEVESDSVTQISEDFCLDGHLFHHRPRHRESHDNNKETPKNGTLTGSFRRGAPGRFRLAIRKNRYAQKLAIVAQPR